MVGVERCQYTEKRMEAIKQIKNEDVRRQGGPNQIAQGFLRYRDVVLNQRNSSEHGIPFAPYHMTFKPEAPLCNKCGQEGHIEAECSNSGQTFTDRPQSRKLDNHVGKDAFAKWRNDATTMLHDVKSSLLLGKSDIELNQTTWLDRQSEPTTVIMDTHVKVYDAQNKFVRNPGPQYA